MTHDSDLTCDLDVEVSVTHKIVTYDNDLTSDLDVEVSVTHKIVTHDSDLTCDLDVEVGVTSVVDVDLEACGVMDGDHVKTLATEGGSSAVSHSTEERTAYRHRGQRSVRKKFQNYFLL